MEGEEADLQGTPTQNKNGNHSKRPYMHQTNSIPNIGLVIGPLKTEENGVKNLKTDQKLGNNFYF